MVTPGGTPPTFATPQGPIRSLTAQQERVVDAIRRGRSYAEIGAELTIARSTVENHVAAIMNVLPNPDHLEPRDCIFLWAWWRAWTGALEVREAIMQRMEDEAREREVARG